MIIKKFQAQTESEAIEAARKELGANVVVMNVRNVKKKGIFAIFSPQMVEVTVALEDDTDRAIQEKANVSARNITEALGKVNSIVEKAESETGVERLRRFDRTVSSDDSSVSDRPVTYERPRPGNILEEKLDSLQNLLEEKLSPDIDRNKDKESEDNNQ